MPTTTHVKKLTKKQQHERAVALWGKAFKAHTVLRVQFDALWNDSLCKEHCLDLMVEKAKYANGTDAELLDALNAFRETQTRIEALVKPMKRAANRVWKIAERYHLSFEDTRNVAREIEASV